MNPDELKAIEEEIAALRRRSEEIAAKLAEAREQGEANPEEPTGERIDQDPPERD
jgi:hypothetical protein